METIQIVLDRELLRAADRAARRARQNRSALVREALRQHLRKLAVLEKEEGDRRGYLAQPMTPEEWNGWETEASWPEE